MEHFFSPKSGGDLRSAAHQSQIIEGDAGVDHTQIIGGDTVKLLGGYIPPSPPGSGTPGQKSDQHNSFFYGCADVLDPVSQIAVQDSFSFMFVIWCLASSHTGINVYSIKSK